MSWFLSLLLKPKVLLALIGIVFVVSVWAMFRGQREEIAHLNTELARSSQLLAAAAHKLAINDLARAEAETTHRVEVVTRAIESEAAREITDAAQRQDAHAMYLAYIAGVDRLRDAERAGDVA